MNKDIFDEYNTNKNLDFDEIPLTDLDYEGVIYEQTSINNLEDKSKTIKKAKIKKAQNFNFKLFLTLGSIFGISIFVIVFFLTYTTFFPNASFSLTKNNDLNNETSLNTTKEDLELLLLEEETKVGTGVIKNIDYNLQQLEVLDITTKKLINLELDGNTFLKDKYNKSLSFFEFKLGDIVDFSTKNSDLLYLNQNSETIEYKNIKNVNIDINNNIIKFDNKVFNYNEYLEVVKDLTNYPKENISPLDILNIKIYKGIVYSIEVEKSHGKLIFNNRENYLNYTVEIDTDIFKPLSEISEIELTEGSHKVVIKGNNINTFVKQINITENQDTIIDLNEIQKKSGLLLINSNVSDYILYVNNEVKSINEPLNLPYGAYKIKIQKAGYLPFETEIIINKQQSSLTVNLESLEYAGKITLTSTPEEAEVYVDNVFIGYTPLTHKTNYGIHRVLIKKSGYKDVSLENINVGETESNFNVVLQKDESNSQNTSEDNSDDVTNTTSQGEDSN